MARKPPPAKKPAHSARLKREAKPVLVALAVVAVVAGLFWQFWPSPESEAVAVALPPLNAEEQVGQAAFAAHCAQCHGINGGGSSAGPPLIHRIYEPSHHADLSFYNAIRNGVRAHHWRFGDMPARPDVTPEAAARILAFVRHVQRANGIR